MEAFSPQLTAAGLAEVTARARVASTELTGEGTSVIYDRAIYLPADETCFHLFAASSMTAVEAVSARAGLAVARIVEAIEQT